MLFLFLSSLPVPVSLSPALHFHSFAILLRVEKIGLFSFCRFLHLLLVLFKTQFNKAVGLRLNWSAKHALVFVLIRVVSISHLPPNGDEQNSAYNHDERPHQISLCAFLGIYWINDYVLQVLDRVVKKEQEADES